MASFLRWFLGKRSATESVPHQDVLSGRYYKLNVNCPRTHLAPCKDNPRCIRLIVDKYWSASEPPKINNLAADSKLRMNSVVYCGLRNPKSLCYMNVTLQMFRNITMFRDALYRWTPNYMEKSTEADDLTRQADSVIENLQFVMAEMEFTNSRIVDPARFAQALRLDINLQKDQQEFITDLLNRKEMKELLPPDLFTIDCVTTISCCECGKEHPRKEHMLHYGLPLNAKDESLIEILKATLEDEILSGSEKFKCSGCNKKHEAIRTTQITRMPSTFTFHVLRSTFDRLSGQMVKSDNMIHIPHDIDFGQILGLDPKIKHKQFRLSTIISHLGDRTDEGHYIATVRDDKTGNWLSINDTFVGPLNMKYLVDKAKINQSSYDSFPSNTALLIVYESLNQEQVVPCLPPRLLPHIEMKNEELKCEETKRKSDETLRISKWNLNRDYVSRILEVGLVTKVDEPGELIPLVWFEIWARDPDTNVPICNLSFLCPHNKADLHKICDMRLIGTKAADELFAKYEGQGPRLRVPEELCTECTLIEWKKNQFLNCLNQDAKEVEKAITAFKDGALGNVQTFWISHSALRWWCLLAELVQKNDTAKKRRLDPDSNFEICLNDNIACREHKKLTTSGHIKVLVPEKAWKLISCHFPQKLIFPKDSETCSECQDGFENILESGKLKAKLALHLEENLPSLVESSGKNIYKVPKKSGFFLHQNFLQEIQQFIESPLKNQVPSFDVTLYKCKHGKLDFRVIPKSLFEHGGDKIDGVLVSEEEWTVLKKSLPIFGEIEVATSLTRDTYCMPDECHLCIQKKEVADILVHWEVVGVKSKTPKSCNVSEYFQVRLQLDDYVGSLRAEVANKVIAYLVEDIHLFYDDNELFEDFQTLRQAGLQADSIVKCMVSPPNQNLWPDGV